MLLKQRDKKIYIGFIGIDGSGKTTCAWNLYQRLQNRFGTCRYIHHDYSLINYLPNIFKKLLKNYASKLSQSKKNFNLKANVYKIREKISSFWASIFTIGIIVNSYLGLRRKSKNNFAEKIIIYDRYFYDNIIQYFHLITYWLQRLSIKLILEPDIVFYLKVEPEIAWGRKKESNIDFYLWQNNLMEYFIINSKIKNLKVIDANRPLNEVEETIFKTVLTFISCQS
jgi:thymidylate kinase